MWRPLLLLSLAGCVPDLFGDHACSGSDVPFEPGAFVSKGGAWDDGKAGAFAHAAAGAKTMVLERRSDDSALVRITYQRAGKTIVETWSTTIDGPRWRQKNGPPDVLRFLDPSANDFGPTELGQSSAPHRFTLVNASDRPVVPSVRLWGDDFVLLGHTCMNLIPIGGACTIDVAFRPGSHTPPFAGSLLATPPSGLPARVALSGSVIVHPVPPPAPKSDWELSPSTIDFGTVTVGTTATATPLATNAGQVPASIAVTVQGDGAFDRRPVVCNGLLPGGRCRLEVTFHPAAPGTFHGTLTAIGPNGLPATAALEGSAVAARDAGDGPGDAADHALPDAGPD